MVGQRGGGWSERRTDHETESSAAKIEAALAIIDKWIDVIVLVAKMEMRYPFQLKQLTCICDIANYKTSQACTSVQHLPQWHDLPLICIRC